MRDHLIQNTLNRLTVPQKNALLRRLISLCIEKRILHPNYQKDRIYYTSGIMTLEETIPSPQDEE